MVELLFCLGVLAGVIALGMYKAPLWLWAARCSRSQRFSGSRRSTGTMGLFGFLLWLSAVAFGALAVPDIRRALLIAPTFKLVKDTMPKVSDTEAQALEAGTVGFDAELFSGTPDWDKLRSIAPIVLTRGGAGLPRRADGRALPHDRRLAGAPHASARCPRRSGTS